jgi:hypothetical protein
VVVASYVVAVIAATVALWCTVVVRGTRATVTAASIMGVAVCGMHYLGMAAARVDLTEHAVPVPGAAINWFLFPIIGLVLLTVLVAVVGAMFAPMPDDLPRVIPPLGFSPVLDVQAAPLASESTFDMRATANAGTRFVPRSANAGGGLRSPRSGNGRADARPPGR